MIRRLITGNLSPTERTAIEDAILGLVVAGVSGAWVAVWVSL